MASKQMDFGLINYQVSHGRVIIRTPSFDFDTFPSLGERLLNALPVVILQRQCDADIHSWLIDFEDCQLFIKAEHYSESVWFESLSGVNNHEELDYLANLFKQGFDLAD